MSREVFVPIVGAILTILATLISAYVIPFIKQKITAEDMATLRHYIEIAVRCADQIYVKEQWQEKKKFVFDYIRKVVSEKLHIQLTPEDIDILIEGFVNDLHNNGVRSNENI